MAQLPPKIPSITTPPPPPPPPPPSWGDDFLHFTAVRRGAHRRSASDSVAFLDDINDADEHLLLSMMFCDDTPSNPSSPSDHNCFTVAKPESLMPSDQRPKAEPESSCEDAGDGEDNFMADPKRVKRILANRQSAQRSRVRKLQYISELERSVTTLQTEVSALSPRVAYLDHQRLILNVDNTALKQRIAALAQDNIFKDAHQEALKKEIERLRQVYHQQNKNNGNQNAQPQLSSLANSGIAMECTHNERTSPLPN